jgi:hypothetical protein
MQQYEISIFDPPQSYVDRSAFEQANLMRAAPAAAAFTGPGLPTEICRTYGYLMLLGQNLEDELRECLLSLELALALKHKKARYAGFPETADFCDLIRMLECQLDKSHGGSRRFAASLHQARKLRNRLAHSLFGSKDILDITTKTGQEKMLARLRATEKVFFPLIMVVNHINRAYAAEFGLTNQVFDKMVAMRKRQQEQIEKDLKEIFDASPDLGS